VQAAAVAVALVVGAGGSGAGPAEAAARPHESAPAATVAAPVAARDPLRWQPTQGTTWQIQYQGRVDISSSAAAYDLDNEVSKAQVRALHRAGRHVICYFSAGSWEKWRADAGAFPASVLGAKLDGWPGERWLDIRKRSVLRPIMKKRIKVCDRKGFDAVDPDNVEGYKSHPGFPLTGKAQLKYNKMIARLAHRRGLAVGLKNDLGQITKLHRHFDFAVNEQCVQYSECGKLRPFLDEHKPVFHVEYVTGKPSASKVARSAACTAYASLGMSTVVKHLRLDAWIRTC
jgi:hypothetical protein